MALKDWLKSNSDLSTTHNKYRPKNYWIEWTNIHSKKRIFVGNITDDGIERFYFEIEGETKNKYGIFKTKFQALSFAKKYMRSH